MGWKYVGPDEEFPEKYVIAAAPHTTNWDFPVFLAVVFSLRIKSYWMGKKELFRWPFGAFLKWLGGIPVERSKSQNMVSQIVDVFNQHDKFVLAVQTEGTRKKMPRWKTGFYHIACGAKVPLGFGFNDFPSKTLGIGRLFMPTGDIDHDIKVIREFYADKVGKYPENYSEITFTKK